MITSLTSPLSFLSLEVAEQISLLKDFIHQPTRAVLEVLKLREQKLNNEKVVIENLCYKHLSLTLNDNQRDQDLLRATITIAGNLERIGDLCLNIASQMAYFKDSNGSLFMRAEDPNYIPIIDIMFDVLAESIKKIFPAWQARTLATALPICRTEYEIDTLYKKEFDYILNDFQVGKDAGDNITSLFIYHYAERMGDQLLNIGEALMLSAIGEKIKIEQFETLQKALEQSGQGISIEDLRYQGIWGTRSGCRIAKVAGDSLSQNKTTQGGTLVHELLHKDGAQTKLKREKDALELWNTLFPTIAPKVLAYIEDNERASLLMEFLPGYSIESMLLSQDKVESFKALKALSTLFEEVREKTLKNSIFPTTYVKQIYKRLDEVKVVHPDFMEQYVYLSPKHQASIQEVFEVSGKLEKSLPAPFNVLIHGDCNANNILWDSVGSKIHFIDLHRSTQGDYVQDVSVFLVSFFRLSLFDMPTRKHINEVIQYYLDFSKEYAKKKKDHTFYARLSLALARSLFTSTRFELHSAFSTLLCKRAFAFLQNLISFVGDKDVEKVETWALFVFPENLLYIESQELDILNKTEEYA